LSSRERWIVFPLLFLSLGISLRDKLVPPSRSQAVEVHAESVVCRRLAVVDEANHVIVQLGAVDAEMESLLRQLPTATAVAVGSDGRRYGVFMKLPGLPHWHSMGPSFPIGLDDHDAAPPHTPDGPLPTHVDPPPEPASGD
jgi:hypothetical protein